MAPPRLRSLVFQAPPLERFQSSNAFLILKRSVSLRCRSYLLNGVVDRLQLRASRLQGPSLVSASQVCSVGIGMVRFSRGYPMLFEAGVPPRSVLRARAMSVRAPSKVGFRRG